MSIEVFEYWRREEVGWYYQSPPVSFAPNLNRLYVYVCIVFTCDMKIVLIRPSVTNCVDKDKG